MKDDRRHAELEVRKFRMWCGMEPIHDADGNLVGWHTPDHARHFMLSIWRDGESPLERYNRLHNKE